MKLLLDTSVVVWMARSPERLARDVEAALADERNDLIVSAVSIFEIAVKRSLGKLDVGRDLLARLDDIGCTLLPVSADHAWRVTDLPWIHKDPFDRLIVAQALVEGVTLVTSDRILATYGVATLAA